MKPKQIHHRRKLMCRQCLKVFTTISHLRRECYACNPAPQVVNDAPKRMPHYSHGFFIQKLGNMVRLP